MTRLTFPAFLLLAAVCGSITASADETRTWTDTTGNFKTEAEFIASKDGQVQLKKKNGSTVHIPLEKLSKPDQEYVRSKTDRRPFQEADKAEQEKKLASALALFGDADSLGGKAPNFATSMEMIEITKSALKGTNLSQGWPLAAKNVAAKYKDVSITVKTTNEPALEKVQAILGKEDSTEEDKEASVTWYKYGWCHFGAAKKKITILRADCNELK